MPNAFKFALRGFRPTGQGIKQVLGKLEAELMNIFMATSKPNCHRSRRRGAPKA